MIEIDGAEGGGQMVRTSLSLSSLNQEPFKIKNIRGSRPNPGLKRQHLEAVKTMQKLTGAEVKGAHLSSEELIFKPNKISTKSSVETNIGTAGSITLLFDTVLPLASEDSLKCIVSGGTDVRWSPTISYYKNVKLPLLREYGVKSDLELAKTGYYPKGNGKAELKLKESSIDEINIEDRGKLERIEIFSKASRNLEKNEVALRQGRSAAKKIRQSYRKAPIDVKTSYVKSSSTGSTLLIKAIYENSIAGFDVLGQKGKPSEEVASEAVADFEQFQNSDASVDQYMADQLMVFSSVVPISFCISRISEHIETNFNVLEKFGVEGNICSDEIRLE